MLCVVSRTEGHLIRAFGGDEICFHGRSLCSAVVISFTSSSGLALFTYSFSRTKTSLPNTPRASQIRLLSRTKRVSVVKTPHQFAAEADEPHVFAKPPNFFLFFYGSIAAFLLVLNNHGKLCFGSRKKERHDGFTPSMEKKSLNS